MYIIIVLRRLNLTGDFVNTNAFTLQQLASMTQLGPIEQPMKRKQKIATFFAFCTKEMGVV